MPSTAVILAPSWQLAQDFTAKGFQLAELGGIVAVG